MPQYGNLELTKLNRVGPVWNFAGVGISDFLTTLSAGDFVTDNLNILDASLVMFSITVVGNLADSFFEELRKAPGSLLILTDERGKHTVYRVADVETFPGFEDTLPFVVVNQANRVTEGTTFSGRYAVSYILLKKPELPPIYAGNSGNTLTIIADRNPLQVTYYASIDEDIVIDIIDGTSLPQRGNKLILLIQSIIGTSHIIDLSANIHKVGSLTFPRSISSNYVYFLHFVYDGDFWCIKTIGPQCNLGTEIRKGEIYLNNPNGRQHMRETQLRDWQDKFQTAP